MWKYFTYIILTSSQQGCQESSFPYSREETILSERISLSNYLIQTLNLYLAFILKLRFLTIMHVASSLFFPLIYSFIHSTPHKHLVCGRLRPKTAFGTILPCTRVSSFRRGSVSFPPMACSCAHISSTVLARCLDPSHSLGSHLPIYGGGKKRNPIALLILLVTGPRKLGSEGLALPTQCTMYQR